MLKALGLFPTDHPRDFHCVSAGFQREAEWENHLQNVAGASQPHQKGADFADYNKRRRLKTTLSSRRRCNHVQSENSGGAVRNPLSSGARRPPQRRRYAARLR